jgi:hypothetical protein
MNFKSIYILSIIFLCCSTSLLAQNNQELLFIENIGQIHDQYGNARKDIDFVLQGKGINIFLSKDKITYQFDADNKTQRVEACLKGASITAEAVEGQKKGYFENHYFASKLFGVAHSCKKVIYKNVYPHIDWVLKINDDNSFEYEYAVGALGDVSKIQMEYKGAQTMQLSAGGDLIINTTMGNIKEHAPVTYTKERKLLRSNYVLKNRTLSYETDPYEGALVIDPKIAWATYYGDAISALKPFTYIYSTRCDKKGNVYVAGTTRALNNIATVGAYQTTLMASSGAKQDLFYAKFDSLGKRQYATYFGAIKSLSSPSITLNNDTVYLTGADISNTLATAGAQQTSFAPHFAAPFLAKFDHTGALQWCTYCGGNFSGSDSRVACDKANNIYMTSSTNTPTADIATPGAYHTTLVDSLDAFIIKYNSAGKRIWGTFYGGKGNDGFSSITFMENDGVGTLYVCGSTTSDTGIATPGGYKTTRTSGSQDLMLVKFDTSGKRIWGTYIGGEDIDGANELCQDGNRNIYLTGITSSTTGIATSGAYQSSLGGKRDLFLLKFSSSGNRLWGTYVGGSEDEAGYAVCNDQWGNIFMGGSTSSLSKIADTAAFQANLGGKNDGFIAAFKPNGKKFWSSYYGGEEGESIQSLACDGVNLYAGGQSNSITGIATKGSFLDSNENKSIHGFLLRIGEPQIGYTSDTIILSVGSFDEVNNTFNLYPNPNTGTFHFETKIKAQQKAALSITDRLGKLVWQESANPTVDGSIKQNIDIESLAAGVYFFHCKVGTQDKVIEFVKQ